MIAFVVSSQQGAFLALVALCFALDLFLPKRRG